MRIVFLFIFLITATVTRADDAISLQQIYDINLTVLEIETVNGEMPVYDEVSPPPGAMGYGIKNATKVPARMKLIKGKDVLFDSGEYQEDASGITLRIRGNTTARAKKKPYKIKLQKKADLLLRGDDEKYGDKNWVLLRDESLSAKTGFKLNELAGMQWTPAYQYVNLILNGEYQGLYMLCESVKRNKSCRLDVDKTGYIFEYDAYWWNEDVYVECTREGISMHYTFKYPDSKEMTAERLDDFTKMIRQAETSMKDGTYADYIDVNSFVTWILLNDILGSKDAAGANYYFTKYDQTEQSKVAFALLWDFDMIFLDEEEWCTAHRGGWYFFTYLFDDEAFIKAYIAKWNELSPTIFDQLFSYLEDYAASDEAPAFDQSVELDNQLWDEDRRTASERTQGIISWLKKRKAWMNQAIEKMAAKVNGIHSVTTLPDSDAPIYNLQGQRVSIPQKGIYLRNGKKYITK